MNSSNETTATRASAPSSKQNIAAQQREDALKYLSKEGQTVESLASLRKKEQDLTQKPKGDNTLYLLMREKAEKEKQEQLLQRQRAAIMEKKNFVVRNKTNKTEFRNTTTAASSSSASTNPLPVGWQKVPDPSTGQLYYWNTATNETTWTIPVDTSSETPVADSSSKLDVAISEDAPLLEGWVSKTHPATQQVFYVHTATGRTVGERPTSEQSVTSGKKRVLEEETNGRENDKRMKQET